MGHGATCKIPFRFILRQKSIAQGRKPPSFQAFYGAPEVVPFHIQRSSIECCKWLHGHETRRPVERPSNYAIARRPTGFRPRIGLCRANNQPRLCSAFTEESSSARRAAMHSN